LRSIEPPNAIFVTRKSCAAIHINEWRAFSFSISFLFRFGRHLEHILADMIIAWFLPTEKCDTVFNFTSLTILGDFVHLLLQRFFLLKFLVCILQPVLSLFFRQFLGKNCAKGENRKDNKTV
jgi:hypothetical protein